MTSEALKYIYSNASVAICARGYALNYSDAKIRDLCRCLAVGFYLREINGDATCTILTKDKEISTLKGFEIGSFYELAEDSVIAILASSSPSLTAEEARTVAVGVHAIIFGYALNPNTDLIDLYDVISRFLPCITTNYINIDHRPYTVSDDHLTLSHVWTPDTISTVLAQNDYSLVIRQIQTSPKKYEADLVNYNWYDVSKFFTNPNLDLMKDAENQYYYVSGRLIYDDATNNEPFCFESEIMFPTLTGFIQATYVNNQPCIQKNMFTGPPSGVKFYREFNDGPYSSGNFSTGIKQDFIDFDKSRLSNAEYSSNAKSLYSYILDPSGQYAKLDTSLVFVDMNGEYNIDREYQYAPIPTGCSKTYEIMRVGDIRTRYQCTEYDLDGVTCIMCAPIMTTGLKFALLEFDYDVRGDDFLYSLCNPYTQPNRTIKRGLNIKSNPYKATLSDGQFNTYTLDGDDNPIWYIGAPQLSGGNSLPFLAFTNSFHSKTLNPETKIVAYCAIGNSNGNNGESSARSFDVSPFPIFTGLNTTAFSAHDESGNFPKVTFVEKISSYISGDDVKGKFFGMGDAFGSQYTITVSEEENAGYFYSGFTTTDSLGKQKSNLELAHTYDSYKIGSTTEEFKYIKGYTGAETISVSKIYSHDNSGNNYPYYYFDPSLLPAGITVQSTGWSTPFAPLPTVLENDPLYQRNYSSGIVENFFPRYSKGPYALAARKFLYTKATTATDAYESVINGFPRRLKYKINVREEAIKEIYGKFLIRNGIADQDVQYVIPIRTNDDIQQNSAIIDIFDCTQYTCDFNQWDLSGFSYNTALNLVDNNWAPALIYVPAQDPVRYLYPSGKNNRTYTGIPTFFQGILYTGYYSTRVTDGIWAHDWLMLHRHYTGADYNSGYYYFGVNPSVNGLYHRYSGYTITGKMSYVKPVFNLKNGMIDGSEVDLAIPATCTGCYEYIPFTNSLASGVWGLRTRHYDGTLEYSEHGQDPIFQEYIGGRRGSSIAAQEGGYHSKGIIGDRWIGFNYDVLGYTCLTTFYGTVCAKNAAQNPIDNYVTNNRSAIDDRGLIFLSSSPEKTEIFTRALHYNPMSFDVAARPFIKSDTIIHNYPKFSSPAEFKFTGGNLNAFYYDLNDAFPLVTLDTDDWYFGSATSGFNIGPFDRDVELFAAYEFPFSGYTDVYLNNRHVSDIFNGQANTLCNVPKILAGDQYSSQNYGETIYLNNNYTIGYVPSGGYAFINVSGLFNYTAGFPDNSFLFIKARTPPSEIPYIPQALNYIELQRLGNLFYEQTFELSVNGMERKYEIPHPDGKFESLLGTTSSFVSFSRSGKLYPMPIQDEFTGYRTLDAFGNESYSVDVEEYWRRKTATGLGATIYASGWREGCRISFHFEELEVEYDDFPYQEHTLVIPSGNCIISGEMGYLSQADASIFTEGFTLMDQTEGDDIRDNLYGPNFSSDVIKRSAKYTPVAKSHINPLLTAPSVMKQRMNVSFVLEDQQYSGINRSAPYNYNKFLWPALSDLKTLNPEETIEALPPDDGNTFLNSTMIISAAQGQPLPNGHNNPNWNKLYVATQQLQTYDSLSTDSSINHAFSTENFGFQVILSQVDVERHLVTQGTTITDIIQKLAN